MRAWGGSWIAVHTGGLPRADRRALRARGRAERLLGLRELRPQLSVRPDNLEGGLEVFAARLHELTGDSAALVFRIDELAGGEDARARTLWDTGALDADYRAHTERLEASAARLPSMPRDAAIREAFLLGRDAIRTIVLDPLLPEQLVPGAHRRALIDAMRAYDKLGVGMWLDYLEVDAEAQRRALRFTEATAGA